MVTVVVVDMPACEYSCDPWSDTRAWRCQVRRNNDERRFVFLWQRVFYGHLLCLADVVFRIRDRQPTFPPDSTQLHIRIRVQGSGVIIARIRLSVDTNTSTKRSFRHGRGSVANPSMSTVPPSENSLRSRRAKMFRMFQGQCCVHHH